MIYLPVATTDPIQQGDIFRSIPRIDFNLSSLAVVADGEGEAALQTSWKDLVAKEGNLSAGPISAVLAMKSVSAIVITQNCDAARGEFLSLCQINDYLEVMGQNEAPKNARKWKNRFYYLPEDFALGLRKRQAVDFRVVLPVRRLDLEALREYRLGRLNLHASEHFRESLAHFFRRYAHDEWYPLNSEEYQAYADDCGEPITPYPGQVKQP